MTMKKHPNLDDLPPYLMNRLIARMNQNLSETLRRNGHTFQDWRILAVLAAHNNINITELTEAAVLPQPTVSRLVAGLKRKGFLERRNATKDSRVAEISITPKGLKAYQKMMPYAVAEYRAAVKGFTAKDDEYLSEMLRRMMKNRNVRLLPRVT
jgi:DNA-binding MarR family transcriptional regulator